MSIASEQNQIRCSFVPTVPQKRQPPLTSMPSAGSENVAKTGGAQPKKRDTTSLQRRVWGSDVRLSCARATQTHLPKSAPCKRTLSTTHTNQGCVLCSHCEALSARPYTTVQQKMLQKKFCLTKDNQISMCTEFGLALINLLLKFPRTCRTS